MYHILVVTRESAVILEYTSGKPAVLDACASRLLADAGHCGKSVNAIVLARNLGLTVAEDQNLQGRARYVRLALPHGRYREVILVGVTDRPERRQWAVAHELGEWAMPRIVDALDLCSAELTPAIREQLANRFASRLLLPSDLFARQGVAFDWDLFALKECFPTASHELIAQRMLEMQAPVVMTTMDNGRLTWRRGNDKAHSPPMGDIEQRLQTAAHQTHAFQQATDEHMRVRVWAIHEAHWKREILRTEPADPT